MQKIYTKRLLISFLVFSVYASNAVRSQTTCSPGGAGCATITQDFNSGTGGFFSDPAGSFVRTSTSPTDADMRVPATTQGVPYSLVSPVYALNTNFAIIGFDLTGTSNSGISSIRISVLTADGNTELAGCVIPANTTTICSQLIDADLVAGISVRYAIAVTTTNNGSGNNRVIVVDNFSNGAATAPLPVNMKSFNAKRTTGTAVVLNWETATESNVKGFEIQRKSGAGNFETIAFVPSKSISGNSSASQQYSFSDINNSSAATQYRIISVDLDGSSKISLIRSVDGLKGMAKILIYPNPSANAPINVVFPNADTRDIQLTDLAGRVHGSWRSYKNQDLILNKLQPGSYIVSIMNMITNQKEVLRLSITK